MALMFLMNQLRAYVVEKGKLTEPPRSCKAVLRWVKVLDPIVLAESKSYVRGMHGSPKKGAARIALFSELCRRYNLPRGPTKKKKAESPRNLVLRGSSRSNRSGGSVTVISDPCKIRELGLTVDPNSPAFLESFEWRRLRMQILKRDGARCACCGATPSDGVKMNVDHIKPRRKHPELALDPNNLQVLCHPCNHGKGSWDETDWRPSPEPQWDPRDDFRDRLQLVNETGTDWVERDIKTGTLKVVK